MDGPVGGPVDGPWHRDGRFFNLDGRVIPPSDGLRRFLKWRLARREPPDLADSHDAPPAPVAPDNERLARPRDGLQITWLGHATCLVQIDGVTLLTDPTFGRVGLGTVRRLAPPPLVPDALPHLDAVLVSHNHYDHCDAPSLRALRARFPEAILLVPEGLDEWMTRQIGGPIRALPWWTSADIGAIRVTAVPAQHWSVRSPGDRNKSHWCGFVARAPSGSVYFAGDTGYGPHFEAIAARVPPIDVALLPIGAYSPRWFMEDQHINPREAVAAAGTLDAHLVPMHWGTYRLTEEPLDEPPRLAEIAAAEAKRAMTIIRPGGTWSRTSVDGVWSW